MEETQKQQEATLTVSGKAAEDLVASILRLQRIEAAVMRCLDLLQYDPDRSGYTVRGILLDAVKQ